MMRIRIRGNAPVLSMESAPMIDALNQKHGIPGAVSVVEGKNHLPKVVLTHRSGSRAEIYLHGAHVCSWVDSTGEERFFLSREAWFEPGKPIRGGIPVIFPQFGAGPLPPHGLARLYSWEIARTERLPSGAVRLRLCLDSTPEMLAQWPHPFHLEFEVLLDEALAIVLRAKNTSGEPFAFTSALHTYFAVQDIKRTKVLGLKGVTLADAMQKGAREVETREAIAFDRETDRVYVQAPDAVRIRDEARDLTITIEKSNLPDVVVWNPWIEKARRMPDFGDEEYPFMVCVETGQVEKPRSLAAGALWECRTRFSVSR